jgi:AraC-like DNA-binding protein
MAAAELWQAKTMKIEPTDEFLSGVLGVVYAASIPLQAGEVFTLPQREGCWHVVFLQEGPVTLTNQGDQWSLSSAQAMVLGGEGGCTVVAIRQALLGLITLRGSLADQFLRQIQLSGGRFFPQEGGAAWTMLAALGAEEERKGLVSAASASSQAYRLLMRLYQSGGATDPQRQSTPPVVEAALSMIQRDFAFLEGIGELAQRLEVSQEYLTRTFSKHMGFTPGKYLNQIRVEYAKLLLQQGEHSVAFVSDACGFTNSNYFARVFRNFVGMNPRRYAQLNGDRSAIAEGISDSIYVL